MKKVVGQVIADVAEYTSTEHGYGDIPIPVKDKVGKVVERYSENEEQCWRHDKSEFVHWKVMMNTVEKEM